MKSKKIKDISIGKLYYNAGLVQLLTIKGHIFLTSGFTYNGLNFLHFEEAMYYFHHGQLEIIEDNLPLTLPDSIKLFSENIVCDSTSNELPHEISALSDIIRKVNISYNTYRIYTHLKRMGYILARPWLYQNFSSLISKKRKSFSSKCDDSSIASWYIWIPANVKNFKKNEPPQPDYILYGFSSLPQDINKYIDPNYNVLIGVALQGRVIIYQISDKFSPTNYIKRAKH